MSEETNFDFETRLETVPHEPGCYLMKDRQGRIVYIGKAKDLKNRVRSYFQPSGDSRPFVERLPRILGAIETIITENEKEALILESTLIKLHKPRYNVRLKDDKQYLSLRIDTSHRWPRVEVVRRPEEGDDAELFGPYDSASSIRRTLNVLNKHFQLRTCTDAVLDNRDRPCLQYQIKRCPGPCVLDVDRDEYLRNVARSMMFLEGRGEELVDELEGRMMEASEDLEFELAAHYRDQIEAIEKALEDQKVVTQKLVDRDAFGFYREGDRLTFQVMFVRNGRLEGARSFSFTEQEFPDEEVLSSFLNLYYNAGNYIPKEVVIPLELPDSEVEAFEELLGEDKGERVYVQHPQRGAKRSLLETAMTNAQHSFEDEHNKEERIRELLEKLQSSLHLRRLPRRMECYDISNFQGAQIVGSMVVFTDGEKDSDEYRRYKIRDVDEQNDFASMYEVLSRRFRRVVDGEGEAPDLVVIDGGKGQLARAVAVLDELGIEDVDVVSLAKARVDRTGFDDPEVTRSAERVFLPGRKNPVILRENSAELYLLQRIRDEAHRFAITFHKKLRRKSTLRSSLDDIEGVGPKTKRALLRHFGSLKKIKSADVEELGEVEGVGPKLAETIRSHFEMVEGIEADV